MERPGQRVAVHFDVKFRRLTIATSRQGAGVTGGTPYGFTVGTPAGTPGGPFIKALNEGIKGMGPGQFRRLIVPPEYAYGNQQVRSVQTFFTHRSVSTFDRMGPFQLTGEPFLYGTTLSSGARDSPERDADYRLGASQHRREGVSERGARGRRRERAARRARSCDMIRYDEVKITVLYVCRQSMRFFSFSSSATPFSS